MQGDESVDVSLLDDPNAYYDIGYSATRAGGGGISRATEAEIEEKRERERQRQRDRRELERRVRDHNLEVERTGQGQKWAMPAEDYSNEAAYADVDRRTYEIQRERGCSWLEASQIARDESESGEQKPEIPCSGDDSCRCDRCNAVTEATLQREGLDVRGGSKTGGKFKHGKKKGQPPVSLTPIGAGSRLSEVDRARQALADNNARLEREAGRKGRPLKGLEPRMQVQARVEPRTVIELNEWTGKGTGELLKELHELLAMARTGAESAALLARLASLMNEMPETA